MVMVNTGPLLASNVDAMPVACAMPKWWYCHNHAKATRWRLAVWLDPAALPIDETTKMADVPEVVFEGWAVKEGGLVKSWRRR